MFAFLTRGGRAAARESEAFRAEEANVARGRWNAMRARGYETEGMAYGGAARSAEANAVRAEEQLAMSRAERNTAARSETANAPAGAQKSAPESTLKTVTKTAAVAAPIAGALGLGWAFHNVDLNEPLNKLTPDTTKLGLRGWDIFDPNTDKPLGDLLHAAKWIPYAFAAALVIPAFRVFVK